MNRQITEIKRLLHKYQNDTASPEEIQQLFKLMASNDHSAEVNQLLQQQLNDTEPEDIDNERWNIVFDRIEENIQVAEPAHNTVRRSNWWMAAAAAILVFIAAGIFMTAQRPREPQLTARSKAHDVLPGKKQATLILASGQQITLTDRSNDTIANNDGSSVIINARQAIRYNAGDSAAMGENKLVTAKGEQAPYYLELPDGTKAWLNAASSITFPTAFTGKNRIVKITGEVYFEVVHNARQPFQVKVAGQTIEDIGTAFNINAYPDEPEIATTLIEGSARLINAEHNVTLIPGQQALSKINSSINVRQANIAEVIAWQKGLFKFKDADLRSVMRQLARWYNVEVRYQGSIPNRKFSGEVTRDLNLSQMLEILSYYQVHFQIVKEKNSSVIIVKP